MVKNTVTIINKLGLHARAAAKLASTASAYDCRVEAGTGEKMVDAKSIMSVMMLAASKGTELTLCCDGRDEQAAMQALKQLIQERFGEPE